MMITSLGKYVGLKKQNPVFLSFKQQHAPAGQCTSRSARAADSRGLTCRLYAKHAPYTATFVS